MLEDRNVLSGLIGFDQLQIDPSTIDPGHIIVAFRNDSAIENLRAASSAIAPTASADSLGAGMFRIEVAQGVTVDQALAFYRIQSDVLSATPDYMVHVNIIPNDPSYGQLYGMNKIGAPSAWDTTTGSGNMVIAVIDTGVDYTHPDLAANMWKNPGEIVGNGIDDDSNGFIDDIYGYDFANNDNNPIDDHGHGTHVAGTIGAVGNNAVGVAGVNWNVKIMALKFLTATGSGSLSNAIKCLNYAVANGAKISNNSWGGGGYDGAMFAALQNAQSNGHIFVAAAGNNGTNNDTTAFYPANYNLDNVVSVAATDANDNRASFSNYGATTVDLGAPGVSIYSTYKNGGYASLSGTSMASPHVAGALALVWDKYPGLTYRQAINHLLGNVTTVTSMQTTTISGGRLNVANAINNAPVPDAGGPRVISSVFSGGSGINKVRFTFSEAIKDGTFSNADIFSFTRDGNAIGGVSYSVTKINEKVYDLSFTTQTLAGAYALTIGPEINDASYNAMNQNGNGLNGELPGDRYTATHTIQQTTAYTFDSADVPKAIPDLATINSVLTINQHLTIADLNVRLKITHTYDRDLRITLISPTGTQIVLSNRRGGSGDNYGNATTYTTFDSQAALAISQGAAPFAGSFRPEQTLDTLNGRDAFGTWTLRVQDMQGADVGTLTAWSLIISAPSGMALASQGSGDLIPDSGLPAPGGNFGGAKGASMTWVAESAAPAYANTLVVGPASGREDRAAFGSTFERQPSRNHEPVRLDFTPDATTIELLSSEDDGESVDDELTTVTDEFVDFVAGE
jgi:subtilisin-like proprotein convertase family protein